VTLSGGAYWLSFLPWNEKKGGDPINSQSQKGAFNQAC
jgi:hypothetical protein